MLSSDELTVAYKSADPVSMPTYRVCGGVPILTGERYCMSFRWGMATTSPVTPAPVWGQSLAGKCETEDIRLERLWHSGFRAMARSMAAVGGTPYLAKARTMAWKPSWALL